MSLMLTVAGVAIVGAVVFLLSRRSSAPKGAVEQAPRPDANLGQVLGGYRLVQKLGEGGMSSVYRAMSTDPGKPPVAIKVMNPALSRDPIFRGRFEREATVGKDLSHPSIVRVLGFGNEAGTLFLVMELVPGEPLRARIRPDMPVREALGYLRQMVEGMAYAHERGCIHRDLKPGNVIVTPGQRLRILDFGLVRRQDFATLTRTGQVLGTVGYVAPEQLDGEAGDARADQYALGVIGYELLTARNPFRGNLTGMMSGTAVPPLHEVRADVPQALSDAVARMMARNPNDRYEHLGDALKALKGVPA